MPDSYWFLSHLRNIYAILSGQSSEFRTAASDTVTAETPPALRRLPYARLYYPLHLRNESIQ